MTALSRQSIAGTFALTVHAAILATAFWQAAWNSAEPMRLGFRVELSGSGRARALKQEGRALSASRALVPLRLDQKTNEMQARSADGASDLESTGVEGNGTGAITSAVLIGTGRPDYPALSRKLGEEGEVLLSVRVAPDGKAREVIMKSSSGYERLDSAAIAFARGAQYEPVLLEEARELRLIFKLPQLIGSESI